LANDSAVSKQPGQDRPSELQGITEGLCQEVHAGSRPPVRLDSLLERDLGLDSLARAELLLRVERHFGVRLPEGLLASVQTLQDVLRAVAAAPSLAGGQTTPPLQLDRPEMAAGRPEGASTLVDVLEWHAALHPDRLHVLFYRTSDSTESLSYASLLASARSVAAGLRRHGLLPGQAVAIMLPSGLDFFRAFFGTLIAGGVPAPLYPPTSPSRLSEELGRQSGILSNCQAPVLVTVDEAKLPARLLRARVPTLRTVATVGELGAEGIGAPRPVDRAQGTALLQYTSGSTGDPKGVILSHANLLANIRSWTQAMAVDSADVCVSWLPLYHDMGLIGTWLGSLYNACPLILMSPTAFLERPARWLWTIHRHRGTVSAAPNFAFELCLRRLDKTELDGLDLSSWRLAINGAEPVSPDTVERFCTAFAAYGFCVSAMAPVYGLAECSVGLAVPPLGWGAVIDRIQRDAFLQEGWAVPVESGTVGVLRFVACGRPLAGHDMRVVDDAGRELPERRVGRLQFRGPSATRGYFRNPEATRRLFDGDWRESGDLAYFAAGQVYPVSRAKDMIIRAGRNIHPYEAEEAIGKLPGVRKGCVAIFGVPDPAAGTERLVAVIETRDLDAGRGEVLRHQAGQVAQEVLDTPLDDIVLVPPHGILKTTSGKIRRAATRDLYQSGLLGRPPPAPWRQIVDTLLASLGPQLRKISTRLRDFGYSFYAWSLLVPLYALVWLATVLIRQPGWNWRLTGRVARVYLRLIGVRVVVQGLANLPSEPCVAVANHASYLDGLVVMAALQRPFAFVAKRELAAQHLAGPYLRAIGTEFVERFEALRGVQDVQHLSALAKEGRSLFLFPEGTFSYGAGLRPFHLGAFLIAAAAESPVVPIAIRGTRTIFRGGSWLLHRGSVVLVIGEPVSPTGEGWEAALGLQRTAREAILRHCGEPDLVL
jgi:1-acyl-sn-glycerol-3-phosphate acyltransferase